MRTPRRAAAALCAVLAAFAALSVQMFDSAGARVNFVPPWTVDVSRHRDLSAWDVIGLGLLAARSPGLRSAVVHQATLDLVSTRRGPSVLAAPAPGSVVPLSAVAVDPDVAGELYGPQVRSTLAQGRVVLGRTSAALRGVRAGDSFEMVDWRTPAIRRFVTVGAVVEDERSGGGEVLMSGATATFLSFHRPSRLVFWGRAVAPRAAFAAAAGRIAGPQFVRASWEPPSVDAVLNQARVKTLLGEFAIERREDGLTVDPAWVDANVIRHEFPIIGPVACHRLLIPPLVSALTEIQAGGLATAINVADTKRSGGCFNGRVIRSESGSAGRNLSRHSWAAALDLNPSSNAFGARPRVDLRVVDVFRRHGFAWGGTWAVPDGMHFEYIGTPRVTGPPLPPTTTTTSTTTTSTTSTTTTSTSTSTSITTTTSSTTTTSPAAASTSSTRPQIPAPIAPSPTTPPTTSTTTTSTTTTTTTTTTIVVVAPPGTVETREPPGP